MDTAQVSGESGSAAAAVKICRLCCSEDQPDLGPIFPERCSYDGSKLLVKKIFECTTVQIVNEGDDQNAMICQGCVAKIDDFYAYREQCKLNDDRIRARMPPEVHIKQEKDLEISISEPVSLSEDRFHQQPRPSSHSTTTTPNELDSTSKDGENSLLQPIGPHTDEIVIKRETIVDDDDLYYNSDGEVATSSKLPQTAPKQSAATTDAISPGKVTKYRIIMAANNRERLIYDGYLYCRHFSRRDGSVHWRCRLGGCQAAVNLNVDKSITRANSNDHKHPPNAPEDEDDTLASFEQFQTEETEEDVQEMKEMKDMTPLMDSSFGEQYVESESLVEECASTSELTSVSADSLRVVTNKKKGETLVHHGYKYCKRYEKMDGSTYWKCRSNRNKCSAGIYVYPEFQVRYNGTHNHGRVVDEGADVAADLDNTMDEEMQEQPFTIIEDVEDDDDEDQPEQEMNDDMAALLTPSVEVMMSDEQNRSGELGYEITTNAKGRECLLYEGHQYSKDRERFDGAMLWRCRRNYDKCRAVAIIYADGRIETSGEHHHETGKRFLERQEQQNGSRMYRITKNQRGNDALVFEGHRFSKEWSRVDGSIIWRCSYRSGMCRVKVVLDSYGMVHRMGTEHEHGHEQTEAPVTAEYCDEEVEMVDDSMLSPVRNMPKLNLPPPVQCPNFTAEQQAAGGYRIIRNRKGFEALVYDGYRYCKVRVRQDGSVKWLCKMNKKTCRAAVDLFPDGSIAKATEFDHNHDRPADMDIQDEDDDVEAAPQEITFPIDPEVFGSSQWYYVKNSKNGISMIHAGYRYTKKCDRVDGTSLWRCSASQRGCKAGVILFPNDTLAMVENAEHSHKPNDSVRQPDSEPDSQAESKPQADVIEINEHDESANEPEMNMDSLLRTVLGGDDIGWMGQSGADTTEHEPNQANESIWFNSQANRPYPLPEDDQPDFRIIKNRRNTDSLVHRGYRYCKIRDRVDGSILWACQMNKKTCKASVNLTVEGTVEIVSGPHNHEKTDNYDFADLPPTKRARDHNSSRDQHALYEISSDVDLTIEEPSEPAKPVPVQREPPPKHPDYYYSTNRSNNECLIYKSFRFCRRGHERPDGTGVWRCSMNGNTCMAGVTIHPDGTPEETAIKHQHRPLAELPPEIERVVKPQPAPPPPPPTPPQPSASAAGETNYKRLGDNLEWKGFHYRKIKELPDSCIIWICQVDSCRVAVKMLPSGQLKMLSESEHNHTAAGQSLSSSAGAAKTVPSSSDGRGRSYRLFKNQKGQMTMLYKGFRYAIRNRNADGSSSWKCRANSSCRVIIHLMPDDRIIYANNNAVHNHDPNWESTKKQETVVPPRVNPLYDYLNIVPGGSSSGAAQKPVEPSSSSTILNAQPSSSAASAADANNYGRNVIEHKGYYYRLIVRKKNGREYWRCVHFKNRNCRSALFCRDNGTVVTSSNGKEHNHAGGADGKPLPPVAFGIAMNKLLVEQQQQQLLEQERSVVQPSPPDEVQLCDGDEERYIDHGDYVIAKNRKDQNTLIFKDRRYYLSYNRSDGSAVWRCAHRKRYKCYAYVRLRPDGRLLSTGEQDHSHSLKTEENPPPAAAEAPKELKNFRIVKNRAGIDILLHENHRFRLNYQRNDGTTHWRCIWARSNHCSAGVYLFANGVLKNAANEASIIHNHPPPSQVRKAEIAKTEPKIEVLPASSTSSTVARQNSRTIPETEGITEFKFVEEGANKILVCRGYRYCYTWVRKDGSIYYRCAEVKKLQCTMGVLLLSNGRLVRANDQCHNHDPSREEPRDDEFLGFPAELQQNVVVDVSQQQEEEEVLEHYPPLVIRQGGDSDYKIVKTSRGESLIYQGYRYWAKNRLANGIVSLCCTRKKLKKCPAMLRLLTNGRVMDPMGVGHTHPPSLESGGDPSMQPISVTLVVGPRVVPPTIAARDPMKVKLVPQAAAAAATQLPPLTFNEESDDDAEQGDESVIGSKRYIFMKSSAQRNYIAFEGFLYDFDHKQHDGCVFYRCKSTDTCPCSLMLLTNGRVIIMDDSLHTHKQPDLSTLRPVGRGSKEFKIVQNKNGSNILVHRGHRYTTPRAKTDGAGIWYCHTYVPEVNRRCYVPIELLPNGRVAPVGEKQHNHAPPFKTKPEIAPNDSKDNVVPKAEPAAGSSNSEGNSNNRMLLHRGHRYNFASQRDDGAILWKCARKGCNASMYRLTDGQIVKGPDHNHEKMESMEQPNKRKHSDLESTSKVSSPALSEGDMKSPTPEAVAVSSRGGEYKGNPYIGQSIINEGYRYVYYLTRKDGAEHWRCCRRIPMKCRGGVYKLPDGSLTSSNNEAHTHPPDHTGLQDSVPTSFTVTELSQQSADSVEPEPEPEVVESPTAESQSYVDDEGSYDYELIDVKGKKRGFYLIHKGAMFVTGHTRRDRARYYRCRTMGCRVAMMLHKNGLLVRANEHTHDCQNAIKTDEGEKAEAEEEEQTEPSSKKAKLDEDKEAGGEPSAESTEEKKESEEKPATNGGSEPTETETVQVKDEPAEDAQQ